MSHRDITRRASHPAVEPPLLAAVALEVRLGSPGRKVVGPTSFELRPSELCAIVGPNGAGKSTLLRALAGLVRPSSGHVQLAGEAMAGASRRAIARTVALVPQAFACPAGFSVREIVTLGRAPWQTGWMRSSERDRAEIERAIDSCGLTPIAERDASTLSGGEQRRVQLARAFAQSPLALLLDEPTAALDPAHAVGALELVRRTVDAQRLACAMVTHDLNLAAQFADRVVLLHEGAAVAEGRPAEVLTEAHLAPLFGPHLHVGGGAVADRRAAEPALFVVPRRREVGPP